MPSGYWHNDYPSMYALQSHGFPYTHRVIFAEPGKRDEGLELSHATMRCMLRSYLPLLLPVAAGATTFTVNDRGSAFASLHVKLQAGESMQAEPGALVKYSGDLRLGIRSSSSWLGRMFAGETPWTTSIHATSSPGECMLCPHSIGDIRILELASDEAICLSGKG